MEDAQDALCPGYITIAPEPNAVATYTNLYALYRKLYFGFGRRESEAIELGAVLPELRRIAAAARGGQNAGSAAG